MIALVNSTNNDGASTDMTVALPSGGSVGDFLVVFMTKNYAGTPTITDNNGSTPLIYDGGTLNMSGGNSVLVFSRFITGSEPSTLHFTANSSDRQVLIAAIFSGVHADKFDVAISTYTNFLGAYGSITCAGVNTVNNDALAIAIATIDGAGNGTFDNPPFAGGWSVLNYDNVQQPLAVGYKQMPTAGATGDVTVDVTQTSGNSGALTVIALKPSVSTPSSTSSPLIQLTQTALEQIALVRESLESILNLAVSSVAQAVNFFFWNFHRRLGTGIFIRNK